MAEILTRGRMEDSADSGRGTSDDPSNKYCFQANCGPAAFKPYSRKSTEHINSPSSQQVDDSPVILLRQTGRDSHVARSSLLLSQIEARRQDTYNVELDDDFRDPWIIGIAIVKDGGRIITDYNNSKVKLFSRCMDFKASLLLSDNPWDIAVIDDDDEAAVTMKNKQLAILDISEGQLHIKHTAALSYDVRGIASYKDKFVVTCLFTNPPSVKLIGKNGTVYWSVACDQRELPLFRKPCYVSSHSFEGISSVIISDRDNPKMTVLNSETGEITALCKLKGMGSRGIIADASGNVYVCHQWTGVTSVLSGDFSEERILLFRHDQKGFQPLAIACDKTANQLIISYYYNNSVGCFDLS